MFPIHTRFFASASAHGARKAAQNSSLFPHGLVIAPRAFITGIFALVPRQTQKFSVYGPLSFDRLVAKSRLSSAVSCGDNCGARIAAAGSAVRTTAATASTIAKESRRFLHSISFSFGGPLPAAHVGQLRLLRGSVARPCAFVVA